MNDTLRTILLSATVLTLATPANADTRFHAHPGTPVLVRPGTAQALNPQPIPPGHVTTSPFTRTLDERALNPQPIPPGLPWSALHGLSIQSLANGLGGRSHGSNGGGTSRHHKPHATHIGWDVTKNSSV